MSHEVRLTATLKPYELPVSTVYELVDVVTVMPSAILHQKAKVNKIVRNIMFTVSQIATIGAKQPQSVLLRGIPYRGHSA